MKQQYTAVIEHKGKYLILKPDGKAEVIETKEEFETNYEKQHKNGKTD